MDVIGRAMLAVAPSSLEQPIDPLQVFQHLRDLARRREPPAPLVAAEGIIVQYRVEDSRSLEGAYTVRELTPTECEAWQKLIGDVRRSFTIEQAAEVSGIGVARLRTAIAMVMLPTYRIDHSRLITHDALVRWADDYRSRRQGRPSPDRDQAA